MRSFLRAALLAACPAAILVSGAAQAHDHAILRGRLVFADHDKPVVRVLDLDTGEVTHSFAVAKANPGFVGLPGGRHVVIKTGDEAGTIRFLDTGLSFDSHGDHVDVAKAEPKLLDFAVTGEKPAHVVAGHGRLALFYDGVRPWERKSEAKAVLIDLKSLGTQAPVSTVWPSPAPQHGIVVPLAGRTWLMSLPNPVYAKGEDRTASSRPDGFVILQQGSEGKGKSPWQAPRWTSVAAFNDTARADASCKLFHGHGEAKGAQVFGCAEGEGGGVLVVSRSKAGTFSARKIAYPDGRRTSTIVSRDEARFMVGNYGLKAPYDALLRIDAAAKAMSAADVMPVPGGQSACQFALSGDGRRLANLTPDGRLRIYEMEPAWRELAAFEAVPPFDCAYGVKTPVPSLAVNGGSAFVSDPTGGRIREFHLDTLKQGLDLPVGGMPASLAGGDAG